ncbi:MAG: glycosyltransferase, partial [Candidatus Omnitrophota bacterium]|nr:glycosyltransferase [Candidatus Omnitrophota bacterium]
MKKPIKTLFVFPVSQVWGGEEVWLKFLDRVDKNKINPFCLVFGEGQLSRRLKDMAIPFSVFPLARIRSPFLYGRNLFRIISLIKKEKFEIVNSLGIHLLTTLTVLFLNITYMLHIHTIHRLPFIDRWCLRRAKNLITVSNYSKEFLVSYGVNPSNIKVIHNGVDAEDMKRRIKGNNLRKELRLADDVALVGYTGRIVKWKNLELLI